MAGVEPRWVVRAEAGPFGPFACREDAESFVKCLSGDDETARADFSATTAPLNSPIQELLMRCKDSARSERHRIGRYLDRAAGSLRATGLLGDEVSANTLAEAAGWCRDETIWTGGDR